jgi:RNA polymerase sigma-70 factor (ECF subfamily)
MTEDHSALHTRPSLLIRLRDSRDSEAWSTFVDTYAPLIHRYCRRRGLQDSDAADITQEVLVQVSRSVRSFDYQRERGRFRDWLGSVTHSKLARHARSGSRVVSGAGGSATDPLDQVASPEQDSEWAEEFNAQVLRVALERIRVHFEPPTWRAFELAWCQDRPAPEAARELGLTASAVYVAKSRVLKRLREEILSLAEDLPELVPLG